MDSNKETAPQRPLCHTHKSNCHSTSQHGPAQSQQECPRPLVYTCKIKLSSKKPQAS